MSTVALVVLSAFALSSPVSAGVVPSKIDSHSRVTAAMCAALYYSRPGVNPLYDACVDAKLIAATSSDIAKRALAQTGVTASLCAALNLNLAGSSQLQAACLAAGLAISADATTKAVVTAVTPTVGSIGTPALGTPAASTPAVNVPAVNIPAVGVPPVSASAAGTPAVSTPAVGTPAAGTPSVGSPALNIPAVGIPAVGIPSVSTPAVGVPAVGVPSNPYSGAMNSCKTLSTQLNGVLGGITTLVSSKVNSLATDVIVPTLIKISGNLDAAASATTNYAACTDSEVEASVVQSWNAFSTQLERVLWSLSQSLNVLIASSAQIKDSLHVTLTDLRSTLVAYTNQLDSYVAADVAHSNIQATLLLRLDVCLHATV